MMDMQSYKAKVDETVAFLREKIADPPQIILMLGTGLGGLAGQIESAIVLPYESIPNFPKSTVMSHEGNLIFGSINGKNVVVCQGRFHYYEGYSTKELTLPVRVLSLLGAESIVVSNAAGGLNPKYSSGTLMIIRDHLNFIPENPLRGDNIDEWGPRFPDLSKTYDQDHINKVVDCARRLKLDNVTTGVYVAIPGPSLETPAETLYLRNCGADAVGMSTVPEVIVAKHAGLKVLGISVIANVNDPENMQPVVLEDVIEQTKKAEADFQLLLLELLKEL